MLTNIVKRHSGEARELRGLFEKQLKELYWAEKAMIHHITKVIAEASSKDIIALLNDHRQDTIWHAARLEQLFGIAGIPVQELKHKAVECLLAECDELIAQTKRGVVRDAGIIAVLQKIKHYEIACYGTMRAYAIALREEEAVSLLEETLEEEKDVDLQLSNIAESHINIEAADKEI
ncbi:MAG: ferritin-like domain-containing protein [Flavobacterium sp.]